MAHAPGHAALSILNVHCASGGTAVTQGRAAGPPHGVSSAALIHFPPAPGPAAVVRHRWGDRVPLPIGEVPRVVCPVCCVLGLVMVGRQARSSPPLSSPHSVIQSGRSVF